MTLLNVIGLAALALWAHLSFRQDRAETGRQQMRDAILAIQGLQRRGASEELLAEAASAAVKAMSPAAR